MLCLWRTFRIATRNLISLHGPPFALSLKVQIIVGERKGIGTLKAISRGQDCEVMSSLLRRFRLSTERARPSLIPERTLLKISSWLLLAQSFSALRLLFATSQITFVFETEKRLTILHSRH